MNNKKQNIIIAVICVVLVGFDIFALSLKPSQNVDDDTSTKLAEIVHEPLVPESEQINPVTDKFYINGYMSINDNTTYMTENNAKKKLNIEASKCNLPNFLKEYKDDIYLVVTYSNDDDTIYDILIYNNNDDAEIKDLSLENFQKMFDVAFGKVANNSNWSSSINLSDLEEDQIYLYTATEATNSAPKLNNNLNANCLIFTRSTKSGSQDKWSKEISMGTSLKSNALSISYNNFKAGDTYEILYRKISNDQLLKLIKTDDIIYLSSYQDGDTIKSSFAKYIYNDTANSITISTTSNAFGIENASATTIPAGYIYGYDWMISNATVKIN